MSTMSLYSGLLLSQGDALCKECFFWAFETEIHHTIVTGKLFERGDKVAIGASGGKGEKYAALCRPGVAN